MPGIRKKASELIKEEVNREVKARVDIINKLRTACDNLVLADKFGFTYEQIAKFNDEVSYLCDSVNKEYITFEDIQKMLKDDYRITIVYKE